MKKIKERKLLSEIWITVPGFKDYRYSNYGRVQSKKSGEWKFITGRPNSNGYIQIGVFNEGDEKKTWFLIHRLVADTFVPNIFSSNQVNHIDYNKRNNHYTNLEWVTPKENIDWGNGKDRRSGKHGGVLQYDSNGNIVNEYRFATQAARSIGCHYSDILWALNGNIKTSHGYVWKWK